jgi:large subunit ribosomal protein L4
MAVVDVFNAKGEKVSEMELADAVFAVPVKPPVLHQVVRMQQARRRAGTAQVKRRGDVRGSTKKLFRQKGTGRARRGDIKSPLLRGGGAVFGPSPRSHAFKVPKKVRRLALKMALSSKLASGEMVVLDRLELERIKTRDVAEVLGALDRKKNVLLVTAEADDRLERSSRNLPNVKVLRSEGLNVYDLLRCGDVIFMAPAVSAIEGRLSR